MTEDMCWLVLHCRPGLVRHGWQGKREGRRETPEGQQRTAHHHLALALLPTTIPSLTITSASAVPTTSTPVTPITCCRVHYSPATPRPKTKRLDRWSAASAQLCTITKRAFMLPKPWPYDEHSQDYMYSIYLSSRSGRSGPFSQHMSPDKASCVNWLQHAGPC
jgi:hypothetical protein